MLVKVLASSLLLLSITAVNMPASAQSVTGTPAVTKKSQLEKINNIKHLLSITGQKYLFQQTVEQMIGSLKSQYPQVPQQYWDTFVSELNADEMLNRMIPIYDKYMTDEDIKGIIKFYESPVGKKTLNVLPQITRESIEVGQQYGRESATRALQKLEAQGYIRR